MGGVPPPIWGMRKKNQKVQGRNLLLYSKQLEDKNTLNGGRLGLLKKGGGKEKKLKT